MSLSADNLKIAILLILLVVLWLVYRFKIWISFIVRNEIYRGLPTIKDAIDDFKQRMNYLKKRVQALDSRIKRIKKTDTI